VFDVVIFALFAAGRMQGYAIGTLMDHFSNKDREVKAEKLAGFDPDLMVSIAGRSIQGFSNVYPLQLGFSIGGLFFLK